VKVEKRALQSRKQSFPTALCLMFVRGLIPRRAISARRREIIGGDVRECEREAEAEEAIRTKQANKESH